MDGPQSPRYKDWSRPKMTFRSYPNVPFQNMNERRESRSIYNRKRHDTMNPKTFPVVSVRVPVTPITFNQKGSGSRWLSSRRDPVRIPDTHGTGRTVTPNKSRVPVMSSGRHSNQIVRLKSGITDLVFR